MNLISRKQIVPLLEATVRNWHYDRAPRMGAALAYYMALSLAPTVVIILAVTGVAFGPKAAQGRLIWQMQGLVGSEGAKVVQSMLEAAHHPPTGWIATIFGVATLFFGATGVVVELSEAMNTIWRVPEDTTSSRVRGLFNILKERVLALALVIGAGLFLLTSLILNTWISAAGRQFGSVGTPPPGVVQTVDWAVSLVLTTALFAFIFKVIPAVRLQWSDVAIPAILTSLLFTAGKLLLGLYLAKGLVADSYGAAGSMVVLLVWIYYSAQVVFLGAEFSRTYALGFGSMIPAPAPGAPIHP